MANYNNPFKQNLYGASPMNKKNTGEQIKHDFQSNIRKAKIKKYQKYQTGKLKKFLNIFGLGNVVGGLIKPKQVWKGFDVHGQTTKKRGYWKYKDKPTIYFDDKPLSEADYFKHRNITKHGAQHERIDPKSKYYVSEVPSVPFMKRYKTLNELSHFGIGGSPMQKDDDPRKLNDPKFQMAAIARRANLTKRANDLGLDITGVTSMNKLRHMVYEAENPSD